MHQLGVPRSSQVEFIWILPNIFSDFYACLSVSYNSAYLSSKHLFYLQMLNITEQVLRYKHGLYFPPFQEMMTERPTDRPGHREVTLSMKNMENNIEEVRKHHFIQAEILSLLPSTEPSRRVGSSKRSKSPSRGRKECWLVSKLTQPTTPHKLTPAPDIETAQEEEGDRRLLSDTSKPSLLSCSDDRRNKGRI